MLGISFQDHILNEEILLERLDIGMVREGLVKEKEKKTFSYLWTEFDISSLFALTATVQINRSKNLMDFFQPGQFCL